MHRKPGENPLLSLCLASVVVDMLEEWLWLAQKGLQATCVCSHQQGNLGRTTSNSLSHPHGLLWLCLNCHLLYVKVPFVCHWQWRFFFCFVRTSLLDKTELALVASWIMLRSSSGPPAYIVSKLCDQQCGNRWAHSRFLCACAWVDRCLLDLQTPETQPALAKASQIKSVRKAWRVPNPPGANPLVAERAFTMSDYWGLTGVARCAEEMT